MYILCTNYEHPKFFLYSGLNPGSEPVWFGSRNERKVGVGDGS